MKKHDDLLNALKAAISESARIDLNSAHIKISYDPVELNATIEGVVEDISKKKRAILAAMSLAGVDGVIDRLKVRPSKSMSDAEIRQHLNHAFSRETSLAGPGITFEIENSTVDIEGTVASLTHKRLAGVIAWWVPGVTEVINSLEVDPPEEDNDDELTDALNLIFEKDPLVDAASVKASVKGSVVTLHGTVRAQSEADAAERDAWYVWGVDDVINKIIVR